MRTTTTITPLFLLLLALAPAQPAPTPPRQPTTQAAIEAIMPTSTTCAPATAECRTAAQAAPFFAAAFARHGAGAPAQQAAVLAWVGLESAELKYKHNVVPGRAGQGTSAMLMPAWVAEYAGAVGAGAVGADADPVAVLALVTPDEYNFGSGPWFLATQCAPAMAALGEGGEGVDEAFAAFMACVGTAMTDERRAYWERAKAVFGL
ncbi:hypothetical protein P8C59_003358 [Phyllachora maydis]|uniref:Uncharacterized protein n=1 Tax=Phyllachora maydis TaxID=1825666 RepID=A0AAD9MBC9_9PEZI|nr:hypothetical protein P8C59_003358 [Phyllachora maydis]